MSKWLNRALAAVPIVPLVPIASDDEANGTIGTNGTDAQAPSDAEVTAAEWEERAAILEYDEGLPRDDAERLAHEQMVGANNFTAPRSLERSEVSQQNASKPSEDAPPALRPANRLPEPSPGVCVLRPAVEVDAAEYDAHLDTMIAELPDGSDERARLAFAKRKGWVVECNGERIFTKGRA